MLYQSLPISNKICGKWFQIGPHSINGVLCYMGAGSQTCLSALAPWRRTNCDSSSIWKHSLIREMVLNLCDFINSWRLVWFVFSALCAFCETWNLNLKTWNQVFLCYLWYLCDFINSWRLVWFVFSQRQRVTAWSEAAFPVEPPKICKSSSDALTPATFSTRFKLFECKYTN